MLSFEFLNGAKCRNKLKIMSLALIFSLFFSLANIGGISIISESNAQTQSVNNGSQNSGGSSADSEAAKALYTKLQSAYKIYTDLLTAGKDNTSEGMNAFNEYVKIKVEYQKLTGLTDTEIKPSSEFQDKTAVEQKSDESAQKNKRTPIFNKEFNDLTIGQKLKVLGKAIWQKFTKDFTTNVLPNGQQKKMSVLESIAWKIGKAVIPSAAVLAFASIAALPLGAVVVGTIAIGAITSGALTYFYEKRANTFRTDKKSSMEILRDVTVSAVFDGILAPFTMATGGLASTIGKSSAKVVIKNAAKSAALHLAGQTMASGASGAVKHLWAEKYFHYDDQIKKLKQEADTILDKHAGNDAQPFTDEEKKRLSEISSEINKMEDNDYGLKDFKRDFENAALSAVISGVVGNSVTNLASNSKYAKLASVKFFGDTSKAGAISNFVVSNPVAFLNGSTRAVAQKLYMNEDISEAKALRDKYQKGTVIYEYYDQQVQNLIKTQKAINPAGAGLNSMLNNLAIQGVSMATIVAKDRIIDKPRKEADAVNERYQKQSKDWKDVEAIQQKASDYKQKNEPKAENYADKSDYLKAKIEYKTELLKYEAQEMNAKIKAFEAQKTPENKAVIESLKKEYRSEQELNRNIEYSRILGKDNYLELFKAKMKTQDAKYSKMTDTELTAAAQKEISDQNKIAYEKAKKSLDETDSKIQEFDQVRRIKKGGTDMDKAISEVAAGKRNFTGDEIREIEVNAAKIAPSTYKARYVNAKVAEMRMNGASEKEILKASDGIYREADRAIVDKYGDNWIKVVYYELAAKQISKIKYDDDGKVNLLSELAKTLGNEALSKTQNELFSHYQSEVNKEINSLIMPKVNQVKNEFIQSVNDIAINTKASQLFK
ncbi:MAG: hypothetical protein QMC67_17340 [Candidatus Wallbacteria bacterium]